MQLTKIFAKQQPRSEAINEIIRAELAFLLERDESRFTKQLSAHLLEDGCNLPIVLAKPRFYELILAELIAHTTPLIQAQFVQEFPALQRFAILSDEDHLRGGLHLNDISRSQGNSEGISHAEFFRTMVFFKSRFDSSGKQMALAVTTSIEALKKEWQLAVSFFQESLDSFEIYLQTLIIQIFQEEQTEVCPIPIKIVRRRLYIALTTSLLRYVGERQSFQAAFGSIPAAVTAMQQDHQVFCRVMAFCQERIPYFTDLASQTFWRTLETLRLEGRR